MVHALATPRRVKRNRHRWRKTASGRQHYNYFRDYDPITGRYVQSDPIGLEGGLSTFGYGAASPLKYSDPRGLEILIQAHPVALGLDHTKLTFGLLPARCTPS